MNALLAIGDFSRMTFLSVKTLRHYHDVGLLAPARIDPHSGYRYYSPDQVATAQLIRRLRQLDLPVEQVKRLLAAPVPEERDAVILGHLDRMTRQLEETRETVESLRRILIGPEPAFDVTTANEPATAAMVVRTRVTGDAMTAWWMDSFTHLHAALRRSGIPRAGADGAIFPTEFFTDGAAELTAYVPVPAGTSGAEEVPGGELASTTYDGPFIDLDTAYGALGRIVSNWAIASDGPVRERYLPRGDESDLLDHRTRVCWPVTA